MTPIALYPSDASLKKTVGAGAFNLFMAYQFTTWAPDGSALVPTAFAIAGVFLIGQAAWSYLKPSPSFEADAEGFSVMGKKKMGWDAYRGVHIHTVRVGFIPVMRSVVIKTGKTILGRRVHIKTTHLSAPAYEMAQDIDAYAKHAKRAQDLNEALSQAPVQAAPAARPAPVAPQAAPVSPRPVAGYRPSGEGSPVTAVPSLSEKLFGRRKVL